MKTKEKSVQIQEVIIRESKNFRSGQINNPGSNQVKNTQEVGRRFTTRCKPLVTLGNKTVRLNFLGKINNKRATGQINPKWTCTRMMGRRRRETAHDLKHITSSVKHCYGTARNSGPSTDFKPARRDCRCCSGAPDSPAAAPLTTPRHISPTEAGEPSGRTLPPAVHRLHSRSLWCLNLCL